jgi:RIO kinase 1
MHVPETLSLLVDEGIIDDVLRPLKSGKEAQIFLVEAGGDVRVAKIYKDAQHRSFKQRALYLEGRGTRNSRDLRAMQRRTRHGRAQEEGAWKSAEVDVLHRLHARGVRVPAPYNFIDGVLIMDLVRGADGQPAPRLAEMALEGDEAYACFEQLLREVVKMLCAGIVHGDLSDYNVLVDAEGPVIIDFPQSVDAASNRNARNLLVRDVDNLSAFLARCVPGVRRRPYGQEIWAAYESNQLTPELELKGQHRPPKTTVDMGALLEVIDDANEDERRRRESLAAGAVPRRREVIVTPPKNQRARGGERGPQRGPERGSNRQPREGRGGSGGTRRDAPHRSAVDHGGPPTNPPGRRSMSGNSRRNESHGATRGTPNEAAAPLAADGDATPKRRRRRRRRGAGQASPGDQPPQRSADERAPSAQKPPPVTTNADNTDASPPRRRRRRRKRRGGGPAGSNQAGPGPNNAD